MKKLLIFVALVLCIACTVAPFAEGAEGRMKILYPVTRTGVMVTVDLESSEGIQLAVQEINAAGGIKGRSIELVTEDTTSTVPGAVQALQKLVFGNTDGVAILGGLSSPFALAWDPILRKTGIPFFTGGTNVKITEQKNPWIFRVRPSGAGTPEFISLGLGIGDAADSIRLIRACEHVRQRPEALQS